jgi:hypothetical protein
MPSNRKRGTSQLVTRASTHLRAPSGNCNLSARMIIGSRGLTFLISSATVAPPKGPKVVLENNCIHWLRHQKPQTLASMICRDHGESLFLQHAQLRGIPVYTQ